MVGCIRRTYASIAKVLSTVGVEAIRRHSGRHLAGIVAPKREGVCPRVAILCGGEAIAAGFENGVDLVAGGMETLPLPGRFEPSHDFFAPPGWSMTAFDPVVWTPVGPVFRIRRRRATSLMQLRKVRILRYVEEIGHVAKTCRYFGIGRSSFYRWHQAYAERGQAGLVNAPHRKPLGTGVGAPCLPRIKSFPKGQDVPAPRPKVRVFGRRM